MKKPETTPLDPQSSTTPISGLKMGPSVIHVDATTVFVAPTFGGPIMRDGFVTETGLVPSFGFDPRLPTAR